MNSNPPFNPGDTVLCLDDEQTYVEGKGQLLRKDHKYTVKRMTWFQSIHGNFVGYIWVNEVNAPYVLRRFEKIS